MHLAGFAQLSSALLPSAPTPLCSHSLGYHPRFCTQRIRTGLGLSFLPLADTLAHMADSVQAVKLV